ncbi:tetratricopeptide repeat protein [Nocardia sp. NPDC051833]|uniref:tetratricopeptide repeat protein n=1 Tax=Nocardia sp. NPDC051833 TaxID=3155674 RepID=UPI00342F8515
MGERVGSRFVGIGIDQYADHEPLVYPVAEVRAVAECLAGVFEGEPLCDPDETSVRDLLKAVAGHRAESMVVLWSGHGVVRPKKRLALPVSNTRGFVNAADVVDFCAESGASQLLCIIDACYAGLSVDDAMGIASAWTEEFPPDSDQAWFGVLVSAGGGETARDGAFGTVLRRLLNEGPRSADMRRRWSVQNRLILGEDLGNALLDAEEWDGTDQRPRFARSGFGLPMIPNPLWRPDAPARVVEHLLRAARAGAVEGEGSWFTGRAGEVDQVVAWVRSGEPGVAVVTGSAGTGKSAIVGRVVSVTNLGERALLGAPDGWGHTDPGQGTVHANAHARGLTVDRLAAMLDEDLARAGILTVSESGPRNGAELVGALQRHTAKQDRKVPVVVVDGLDEARGEAFTIATDLLCRIAPFATVVVSTRDLPATDTTAGLVETLSPIHLVDLDDADQRRSQQNAIGNYLRYRLRGVSPMMDADLVAAVVAAADQVETPFLVARIIADQLRAQPIDTSIAGWESGLVLSLGQAFDTDLARIAAPTGIPHLVDDPEMLARKVLTALAWGLGAGLPEPEWMCVAGAMAGVEISSEHISWVLDGLGRYVVQDGEAEVAVYRLAHQSLADHLRRPFQPTHDAVFDPAAGPVTAALLERYRALLDEGHPAYAPMYLWRYAFRHVADAGPAQVDASRELAHSNPALLPDLAAADITIANAFAERGYRIDAVAPTEEAVTLRRTLAHENPAYQPDLAGALNNLGIRYSEIGRRTDAVEPTEEAVTLYRTLACDNPAYQPDLAGALNNLGVRYSAVGRRTDAVEPTEEAVTLFRALAEDNPAYQPDLAMALNNLGIRYSEIGRRTDAVAPVEESVTLYRALAHENPAYQPDLAGALNNLGIRYSEIGRRTVAPVEESVTLYRALAHENPAYQPDLAMALNNLGIRYSEIGRRTDAVAPTEEAVTLFRTLAHENPAYQPDLAGALNNLGTCYSEIGRRTDAVAPTEEAVTLYRTLAHENPAYQPDLATALNNLGTCYSEIGRRTDAVAPTEDAVTLFRTLAEDNPAYQPDLAMALNNLGTCYGAVGRRTDAVAPTEEAVTLYRALACDNPAYQPGLAAALNNLTLRLSEANPDCQADAVWEEVINSQTTPGRVHLLWSRASAVPEGDLRAVAWLIRAKSEGTSDSVSVAAIHDCARAHRRADPEAWDRQWSAATGAALPAWLVVDPALLDVARAWIATSTYNDEYTYLLGHPELLTDDCDVAVEEALLDSGDAERYTRLRAAARDQGIPAAYEPLFRSLTLQQFLTAEPPQQRELLTEHRDRLLHDAVRQHLTDPIDADPDDPRPIRAAALISLAAHNAGAATLSGSFDALADPTLFPVLLAATARSGNATELLGPVGQLAYLCAETAEEAADAIVYLACAVTINDVPDNTDARELLQHAIGLAGHRRTHWITLLAELSTVHPTLVSLIPLLATEPTDVQD